MHKWLRKRFTLYVVSHELFVIPFFVYVASFAVRDPRLFFTWAFAALLVFTGMQLFLLEVARKMRAKEHEVASLDTYTAQYGVQGASVLLFCIAFFSIISLTVFERLVTGNVGTLSLLGYVALLAFVMPIRAFMYTPSARNASRLFAAAIFFFATINVGFVVSTQFLFV